MIAFLLALCAAVSLLAGCQTQPVPTETTGTVPSLETLPPQTEPTQTFPEPMDVVVNEAMADNKYMILGHSLDWVELYNREDVPVSLDGYYLTDDPSLSEVQSLEGLEIPAGGYLVITLDDASAFRLSGDGEEVALLCGTEVISVLALGFSEGGEAFGPEGVCQWPSPGFANNEEGYIACLEATLLPPLAITEAMSSNSAYAAPDGDCYDWVEVQNTSDAPIDLSAYTLTDKRSEPLRYSFPQITLEPGEFYVVYCSDDASLGEDHAAFKLSASGETVYLAKDGMIADALQIPSDLQKNHSYGRDGNVPAYLQTPTPRGENMPGYRNSIQAPAADIPSGMYAQTVTVTLSGEGTVYYTTDGSRPTTKSQVYTQPLEISGVTTVRAFCVSGERTSAISAYTYCVGVEHALPVLSISIPQAYLTGGEGVLNHIEKNYEHEAVLTLIEDGEEKFSVPFGFRLHGNDSRKGSKQNFQLRFRSEYGAGKLKYKLFEDREIEEFNSLLLKGGSEDWYTAMIRDEMATAICNGTTSLYTQAMKPVALYLGGKYWGVYFLRERFSDDYVASHLNVSPESVDLLYSSKGYVQNGSAEDFTALKDYVRNHDMSKPEHYAYLCERIDVQSLMDWYICRSFLGDRDLANIRRFRSLEGDGKWRWMFFDLDWCFYHNEKALFSGIADDHNGEPILMSAVLRNPEGKDAFLKRYAELMGTILNETYINSVIDDILAQIGPEMPKDRERWGVSYTGWEERIRQLRDFVADGARNNRIIKDLKNYFSLTTAQVESYFGDLYTG